MKVLTRSEVLGIARLARLQLSDEECDALGRELGAILEHMETLSEVDTAGVEPLAHAVPMDLRLRPDDVEPSLPAAEALGQAPAQKDDHFQVPKIIDGAARSVDA